jgi:hypothetical protein
VDFLNMSSHFEEARSILATHKIQKIIFSVRGHVIRPYPEGPNQFEQTRQERTTPRANNKRLLNCSINKSPLNRGQIKNAPPPGNSAGCIRNQRGPTKGMIRFLSGGRKELRT